MLRERRAFHLCAVTRLRRRKVTAVPHGDRVNKVFMEMIDILDHPVFERAAHHDKIEHGQMLDMLAQAPAAGVAFVV